MRRHSRLINLISFVQRHRNILGPIKLCRQRPVRSRYSALVVGFQRRGNVSAVLGLLEQELIDASDGRLQRADHPRVVSGCGFPDYDAVAIVAVGDPGVHGAELAGTEVRECARGAEVVVPVVGEVG